MLASNQLHQERGLWFDCGPAGAVPFEMWSRMWDVTQRSSWNVLRTDRTNSTEANCNLLSLAVTLCTAIPSNRHISAPFIWEKPHYRRFIAGENFHNPHLKKYAVWLCEDTILYLCYTFLYILSLPFIFISPLFYGQQKKSCTKGNFFPVKISLLIIQSTAQPVKTAACLLRLWREFWESLRKHPLLVSSHT